MLDGGRPGLRDGGLLARPRAAPGGRDPLRRGDLHEPDPGPPRLPRRHGGVLRTQSALLFAGTPERAGAPRSSTSTTPTAPGSRPSSASRGPSRSPSRPRARRPTTSPSRSPTTPPDRGSAAVPPTASTRSSWPLPGHFNVANALAAIATAGAIGASPAQAAGALAGAEQVPGRMEPIDEGQPFAVLVDYAHTPDSLENVLRAARRLTAGRLICVFGAGGDRDREKRPLMGAAAAALADLALVTSDNPRSEDPAAIVAEILAGMEVANGAPRSRSRSIAARRSRLRSRPPSRATPLSSPARATSRVRSSRAAGRSRSTTARSPARSCGRCAPPRDRAGPRADRGRGRRPDRRRGLT